MQPKVHVLRQVRATFRELPLWQKLIVVTTSIFISPALLLVGILMALSLFPLALFGWSEGERDSSLYEDVARGVKRQAKRTERYYAR